MKFNNFFGKNVELQYYLNSFSPINGASPRYPVDQNWGKVMDETLAIHGKEKGLFAGAFFLKGKMTVLGKTKKVFTPLYLFETELIYANEVYFIEVNTDNPIVNPAFLDLIKTKFSAIHLSFDDFVDLLPTKLDFDGLFAIKNVLNSLLPNVDCSDIDLRLKTDVISTNLKEFYLSRAGNTENYLVASAAIGLIKKPTGSLGIINELTTLAKSNVQHKTLQSLFMPVVEQDATIKKRTIHVPASLSESQKRIFYTVDAYNKTLVIGPPGTGKSFTIAALASELISQGKSVLIASKNEQANQVILDKFEKDFELYGLAIQATKRSLKRKLKKRLNNILNGMVNYQVSHYDLARTKNEIDSLTKEIQTLVELLKTREKEEKKWGEFYYHHQDNFFNFFKSKWIEYQHRKCHPIWKIKKTLDNRNSLRIIKTRQYTQWKYSYNLYFSLSNKRKQVTTLIKALGEKTGNQIQEQFDRIDFSIILKALPAWICTTSDIHSVLPLQQEMFDVLIMDESSQCDIASAIPLIYRAKKIVIIGDPKQLRHISFLSKAQQTLLQVKNKVDEEIPDYRKTSILDLVNETLDNQNQVIFLDEHYRSNPDIIRFSNERFYENKLKIMTETPTTVLSQNIFLKQVNGQRNSQGQNLIEADAILHKITAIIQDENELPANMCQSIGVISPFRSQVDLIQKLIKTAISLVELKRHRVLIGTPFHFQGEERDVIFISFVVDNDTHPSTFIYLNREDVFNVSITRARKKQLVYSSIDYRLLPTNNLLAAYLDSISRKENHEFKSQKTKDHFVQEVSDKLKDLGAEKILTSFPISGVDVDLVVIKNQKTYCIDLIGYPGEYEEQFTYQNIQMLNRMNHPIFFLPYSSWYLEREKCEENLARFIQCGND